MNYGYARVSTDKQDTRLQTDALLQAGVLPENIFQEYISGKNIERPQLQELLKKLEPGDKIVVWKLDRLGRSVTDLAWLANQFQEKGIELQSVQESIDTTSATGRFVFHMLSAVAEFERGINQMRIRAGVKAAKERGVQFGKPSRFTPEQIAGMKNDMMTRELNVKEIAAKYETTPDTVYKYARGALGRKSNSQNHR